MQWGISEPAEKEAYFKRVYSLLENKVSFCRHFNAIRSDEYIQYIELLKRVDLIYGDIDFIKLGMHYTFDYPLYNYYFQNWAPCFPRHVLFNSDYKSAISTDICLEDIKNSFVKCDANHHLKSIAVKTDLEIQNVGYSLELLKDSDVVVIAPIKDPPLKEYRLFWSEYTGCPDLISTYYDNGKKSEESVSDNEGIELKEYVEFIMTNSDISKQWPYTVDIALTDKGYSLLELNCPYCTGLYEHHDPKLFIEWMEDVISYKGVVNVS